MCVYQYEWMCMCTKGGLGAILSRCLEVLYKFTAWVIEWLRGLGLVETCSKTSNYITLDLTNPVLFSIDGLIDCEDPDCCPSPVCRDRGHCQTVPDPLEILLRKQPPSSIASFFEHVRFLVEENSVQRSATVNTFSSRWHMDLVQEGLDLALPRHSDLLIVIFFH